MEAPPAAEDATKTVPFSIEAVKVLFVVVSVFPTPLASDPVVVK